MLGIEYIQAIMFWDKSKPKDYSYSMTELAEIVIEAFGMQPYGEQNLEDTDVVKYWIGQEIRKVRNMPMSMAWYSLPKDYTYPSYKTMKAIADIAIDISKKRELMPNYNTYYIWLKWFKFD